MTTEQARALLDDAKLILEEARHSAAAGHHHRVVRKAQECAELGVKSLFRHLGIEYPKSHILGRVIKRSLERLGLFSQEELEKLAFFSDILSLDREPAFYGTPDGTPPSELFDARDSQEALERAQWILDRVAKAFRPA